MSKLEEMDKPRDEMENWESDGTAAGSASLQKFLTVPNWLQRSMGLNRKNRPDSLGFVRKANNKSGK